MTEPEKWICRSAMRCSRALKPHNNFVVCVLRQLLHNYKLQTTTLPACIAVLYFSFDGGRVVKRFYKCFHSPRRPRRGLLFSSSSSASFLALSVRSPETVEEAFFTFSFSLLSLSLWTTLGFFSWARKLLFGVSGELEEGEIFINVKEKSQPQSLSSLASGQAVDDVVGGEGGRLSQPFGRAGGARRCPAANGTMEGSLT